MRRVLIGIAAVAILLSVGASPSAIAGTRTTETFDLSGGTISCPTHTYTFLAGSHSVFDVYTQQSASGNTTSVLTTDAATDAHLVDEAGATYTIRGVIVFHETTNAITGGSETTYVAKLLIVADSGGGMTDIDNLIIHSSPNDSSFSFQFGTCGFD
jgi:hypothetical protein